MNNYNNSNNASTTISAGISASATTLLVDNGAILPNAPFLLTLEHFDNEKVTVREIVKCTAKIGNSLTIVRSAGICVQDDTATPKVQNNTPHSFGVGDFASIYWTSEQVKDIQDEINQKLNITDFQAGTYVYSSSSTETDAYSITIPGTITAYALGQVFRFMADVENTGNATLNVNGLGAIEILKNHDQHLQSGDIEAGQIVEVAFDRTNFQMNSQIAQVVSLDDISSLSYNDLTCYAGEEIHENDLIITNGNSFNPDRTDGSTDVGGQTVNKYAIGFIGNGERTDTFSIKTSVIQGFEPDSITINLETDDNGKPSGTVLATSSSLNAFKSYTDFSSFIDYKTTSKTGDYYLARSQVKKDLSNFNDCFFSQNSSGYFLSLWNGKYFSFTFSRSGEQYGERNHLKRWSKDNKHFLFVRNSTKFQIGFTKITDFNDITSGSVVSEINDTPTGSHNFTNYAFGLSEDGKTLYFCRPTGSSAEQTIGVIHTNTPRDFTGKLLSDATYYSMGTLFLQRSNPVRPFFEQEYNGKRYLFTTFRTANNSNEKLFGFVLDENNDITSFEVFDGNGVTNPCVKNRQLYWQKGNNIGVANLEWDYDYKTSKTIQLDTTVKTTKGTKYRLTITPVVTGSVVDSVKIYDKEGEYYSECAVRDLNSWSNVSDKTPYIDSSCIKARYALKSNLIDSIDKIPYGFANGDFTEFESVHYCFKGIKKGFQGLETNTVYYSDDDGKITTVIGPCKVGKTTSPTDLMIDLDYSKSFSKSYSGKFTDSFKVPYDGYIKYSFSVKYTTYSFVVGGTNVIDTKSANIGSTSTTVSLAYTFVPAGTTITLSTTDNNGTIDCSGKVDFLSARGN